MVLARSILLAYAALALTFEWWYLGTWYRLPTSLKRLLGWALMLASIIVVPLNAYREFAHADAIGLSIIFINGVASITILFYRIRREK